MKLNLILNKSLLLQNFNHITYQELDEQFLFDECKDTKTLN